MPRLKKTTPRPQPPPDEIKRPETPPPQPQPEPPQEQQRQQEEEPQEQKQEPLKSTFPLKMVEVEHVEDVSNGFLLQNILEHILKTCNPDKSEEFYESRRVICVDLFIRIMVVACRLVDKEEQYIEEEDDRKILLQYLFLLAGVNFKGWYENEYRKGIERGNNRKIYSTRYLRDIIKKYHRWD